MPLNLHTAGIRSGRNTSYSASAPPIGHLKSDHRLGRNFCKGVEGDAVNILLAAAAYNFQRAMRALWNLLKIISERTWMEDFALIKAFLRND